MRAVILFGLAFCAAAPAYSQQVNTAPPKTVFDIGADGTALHLQSQLQCPLQVGDFRRNGLTQYEPTGFDVSCGFLNPGTGLITVYLTERPVDVFEESFQGAIIALQNAFPGVPRDGDALQLPSGMPWKQTGFALKNGNNSDLIMAQVSGWELKVRVTYQPSAKEAVSQAVQTLLETALNTAGKHLASCAAAPAPARSAQIVESKPLLNGLIKSGVAMAQNNLMEGSAPGTWCAEDGMTINGEPFIYWRNIAVPEAATVNKMSGLYSDEIVLVVKDASGKAVAAELGEAEEPEIYDMFVSGKDRLVLRNVYRGRPSVRDITRALTKQNFAVIDKNDKSVIILYKP